LRRGSRDGGAALHTSALAAQIIPFCVCRVDAFRDSSPASASACRDGAGDPAPAGDAARCARRTPRPTAPPQPIPSAPSLAPDLRCVAHSFMAAAAGEARRVAARRQRRGEPLGPDARIAPRSAARWRVPLCHHVRNRRGNSGALLAPPPPACVARAPQPTAALPPPLRSWKSASARSRRRPRCAARSRASRLLRTYPSRSGRFCAAGARTRSWPWRATYGPTCSTSAPRAGPRCCLSTRASAPAPPHAGRTGPRARSWPACSTAFRWYRPT